MIYPAAPGGSMTDISEKHRTAPPCPVRRPEAGALISGILIVPV